MSGDGDFAREPGRGGRDGIAGAEVALAGEPGCGDFALNGRGGIDGGVFEVMAGDIDNTIKLKIEKYVVQIKKKNTKNRRRVFETGWIYKKGKITV